MYRTVRITFTSNSLRVPWGWRDTMTATIWHPEDMPPAATTTHNGATK